MRPKTDGILESSLYVSDVPRSIRFYEEFGLSIEKQKKMSGYRCVNQEKVKVCLDINRPSHGRP